MSPKDDWASDLLARSRKKNKKEKGGGTRKYGRNRRKCGLYRQRVGRPRGRGVPGNKRGAGRA